MLFVFCIELDVKLYSLGRLLVTQIRSRNNSPFIDTLAHLQEVL